MISASAEGITIIKFGMGSPNAAIIMDLLSAISPKACLFLGKCGGIDVYKRQALLRCLAEYELGIRPLRKHP